MSLAGALVRPRMSTLDPGKVTGYAVALRASGDDGIEPVWFGGGKLAPDLTFPQLQARWCRDGTVGSPGDRGAVRGGLDLDPAERQALWNAVAQAVDRADEQLRAATTGDPTARALAEAAAIAASEVLAAVGRLTERSGAGPIQAADAYDRAARGQRRRSPVPTGSGFGPAKRQAGCEAWSSSATPTPADSCRPSSNSAA